MEMLLFLLYVPLVIGEIAYIENPGITTPPPPPQPYAFGYAAGRFPGHIDRTHSEVSDGSGIVQGSYSYIDPNYRIRTVEYVADKNGFHPITNQEVQPLPIDTPIVAAAKQKHLLRFSEIASSHQQPIISQVILPVDSVAVQNAKFKHLSLYQKIADEHARIASELETLNKATEEQKHNEKYR